LSTKAETPLKPGVTKELAKDYAVLAIENAGTAVGSALTARHHRDKWASKVAMATVATTTMR
jgi:hypothetical protein